VTSILDEIVARKKREIAAARLRVPFEQLVEQIAAASPPARFPAIAPRSQSTRAHR
jgi:hypothetical protein